jgi:hypothetical protein
MPGIKWAGWGKWGACDETDCGNCTARWDTANDAVVDLGAGGWVDSLCIKCDQVIGEWNVGHNTGCTWYQAYASWCGNATLVLDLRIVTVGGDSRMDFYVQILEQAVPALPSSLATYQSALMSDADCDGFFGANGKATLTKQTDTHTPDILSRYQCSGSLPSTVYAWMEC